MPYRFFLVPLRDAECERELNSFLRSHKILSTERRWVENGPSSFWSFCVDYLDSAVPSSSNNGNGKPYTGKAKVDYKEKLTPEQFAVYAKLREMRKVLAEAESVPVYAVFTNEQLAQMVLEKVSSKAAMEKIAGVGTARVAKYGEKMMSVVSEAFTNETSRVSA
jgi:superfamily II DNA helicase RecQ